MRLFQKKSISPYARACDFKKKGDGLSALCFAREQLRWEPKHAGALEMTLELSSFDQRFREACAVGPEFAWLTKQIGPHTMLSDERTLQLYLQAKRICVEDLPGDFVECGVAGGGSTLLLALVVALHSRSPRCVFSFDTFAGMPQPGPEDTAGGQAANETGWGVSTCSAPLSFIEALLERYGVRDTVELRQGLFQNTLPTFRSRNHPIAFLHMDGDWYSSTLAILENLYPILAVDAYVQVDDYGHWDGCRKAFHDYFAATQTPEPSLEMIDYTGRGFRVPSNSQM